MSGDIETRLFKVSPFIPSERCQYTYMYIILPFFFSFSSFFLSTYYMYYTYYTGACINPRNSFPPSSLFFFFFFTFFFSFFARVKRFEVYKLESVIPQDCSFRPDDAT